jgi:sugar phosphate isomerase/epimerase
MKLGISIYSISRKIIANEISPEKGVEILASMGAEVIEIVPFGIDIVNDSTLAVKLLKTASDCGTKIDNYSLNANFLMIDKPDYQKEIDRVKSHIDAASKLDIPTMRIDVCGYRRKPEHNTIGNFINDLPLIIETYNDLCDYAAQYNMTILLENHGFQVNGSDRVGAIMHKMSRANFAHQLDIGNNLCVDEEPVIAVKKMINYAETIHMKDFYIRDENNDPGDATQFDCSGAWFRSQYMTYLRGSILSQGDMNIKKIAELILNSAFDGNIFLEYEGMEECIYGTTVGFNNMVKLFKK